jgi:hypothetical protein
MNLIRTIDFRNLVASHWRFQRKLYGLGVKLSN